MTIKNTDKWGCRQIAAGLAAFGIRHVVTSPGSRNAPLIMAVARHDRLHTHTVVDERSAAFTALGMASVSGEPIAIICTSGTALLNYGPAIAEAYYRHIPLIAITADRPSEWIDQDDSQTMRQPGALRNIVKASYSIKGEAETETEKWYVNRTINDALLCATNGRQGPVHINIALSAPLTAETAADINEPFRKIDLLDIPHVLPNETARALASQLASRKVMVVAGFNSPSAKISRAMGIMAALPNVAVMAEGLANIHCRGEVMFTPDRIISGIAQAAPQAVESLCPDILITFGGALVSATLKKFLRTAKPCEHWHIGVNDATVDCFMSLTRRIEMPPEGFFPKLATSLQHLTRTGVNTGTYAVAWHAFASDATAGATTGCEWNALAATGQILSEVPAGWNLQLSNGMSVRYALQFPLDKFHRADCNRGVSGIDGSSSTAVGASFLCQKPTLFITGDMSMQYDIAALSSPLLTGKLKIVVINNGGGGIFKYVDTTARLPETPQLIHCQLNLPVAALAETYGFSHIRASGFAELTAAIKEMTACNDRPVILELITDGDTDARVMKEI